MLLDILILEELVLDQPRNYQQNCAVPEFSRLTLDANSKARVGSTALFSVKIDLPALSLPLAFSATLVFSFRLRLPIAIELFFCWK